MMKRIASLELGIIGNAEIQAANHEKISQPNMKENVFSH